MKTPTLERAVGRDLLIALACVLGQLLYSAIAVYTLYHYTKVDVDALLTWWFGYMAIGVPTISAFVVDYTTALEERISFGRRKDDVLL
jgi:hypothetical protein